MAERIEYGDLLGEDGDVKHSIFAPDPNGNEENDVNISNKRRRSQRISESDAKRPTYKENNEVVDEMELIGTKFEVSFECQDEKESPFNFDLVEDDSQSNKRDLEERIETLEKKLKFSEAEKDLFKDDLKRSKRELEKAHKELAQTRKNNLQLKDELKRVRNLNYEYQDCLLTEFRKITYNDQELIHSPAGDIRPRERVRSFSNGDFQMNVSTIDKLKSRYKCGRYVKALAYEIWGDELMNRSITGVPSNRKGVAGPIYPCLTPEKLDAIRELYREHLITQGFNDTSLRYELGRMTRYITEKICDMRKSYKKKTEGFSTRNFQNKSSEEIF